MTEEQNGTHRVPHIDELANGHEPFITALTASRRLRVGYGAILMAVRHGELTNVAFLRKDRGAGVKVLIPEGQMTAWAEAYHTREQAAVAKREEREQAKQAKRTSRKLSRDEHMALMRAAKEVKRKSTRVSIPVPRRSIELGEGEQAVEDSLRNLSKREVYAILAALERLASVHAERAEKESK